MNDIAHDLCLGLAVGRAHSAVLPIRVAYFEDVRVCNGELSYSHPCEGDHVNSPNPTHPSDCNATIPKPLLFGWANQSKVATESFVIRPWCAFFHPSRVGGIRTGSHRIILPRRAAHQLGPFQCT